MSEALAVSQVIAGVDAALRAAAEGELPASLAAEAETALAEAEQTGLPTLIARAAACLARVLTRTGRPREALKPVNRGRAALVGASAYFAQVELALAEAEAHRTVALAEDDQCAWRAALAACRQALPAVEHGRLGADAPHLQAGFMRGRSRLYAIGAHALLALGDPGAALQMADRSKARGMPHRPPGAYDPALLRTFREAGVAPADTHTRMNAWNALMRKRVAPVATEGVMLSEAQAGLAPDQAALAWHWLADNTLLVAAFDRAHAEIQALPVRAAARARMRAIADQIIGAEYLPDTMILEDIAHDDLAVLMPEFAREIVLQHRRIVLSPHGVLHGLPLQALPTPEGPLGLVRGLCFIPALSALTSPITTAPAGIAAVWASRFRNGLGALPETPLIAAAALGQAADRGEPVIAIDADRPARGRLLELADAGRLAQLRQLWLCCHGFSLAEDTPLNARLEFATESLDGLDLATLDLRTDLTVLLACHAGQRAVRALGMPALSGDDLLGLQGALRVAGVRQLLAPQWQLEASILRQIVPDLIAAPPGETDLALQSALARFIKSASGINRRVVRWAPLQLFQFGASQTGENA